MTATIEAQLDALRDLRLPELQARFAEIVGEETRCPNKTFLLRRIGEALEASAAAQRAAREESVGPPLRDLDVDQLRTRYVEVVGRGTGSRDKRYLIWKIRQAAQGKVPVGPVGRRQPGAPPAPHKVLPLRMPAETVEALDDVRRRRGLKSRMDLFRHALDHYLTGLGEEATASRVRGA